MRLGLYLGLATAFASLTSAHTILTNIIVNDVNQGDGTCIRMGKNGNTATGPIASLSSAEMACGHDGETAVAFTCPAEAGAKLTFEFREWSDAAHPGSIDPSHKGPIAFYVKSVSDMSSQAAGDGWFKIWDQGYDEKTGQWAVDKLVANQGLVSITLPSSLPTGYYLIRSELLALQNVPTNDPQFYVNCAQVFVQGTRTGALDMPAEHRVSIPGHVGPSDGSVTYDIYAQPLRLPYPIPGPKVYLPTAAVASAKFRARRDEAAVQQNQDAVPVSCLVKNANWCGTEMPAYSDESGCWASANACFKQLEVCYASMPPTGGRGCDVWNGKCLGIQQACTDGNFRGPPNLGAKLPSADVALPGPIPPVEAPAGLVVSKASYSALGNMAIGPAETPAAPSSAPEPAPAPEVVEEEVELEVEVELEEE